MANEKKLSEKEVVSLLDLLYEVLSVVVTSDHEKNSLLAKKAIKRLQELETFIIDNQNELWLDLDTLEPHLKHIKELVQKNISEDKIIEYNAQLEIDEDEEEHPVDPLSRKLTQPEVADFLFAAHYINELCNKTNDTLKMGVGAATPSNQQPAKVTLEKLELTKTIPSEENNYDALQKAIEKYTDYLESIIKEVLKAQEDTQTIIGKTKNFLENKITKYSKGFIDDIYKKLAHSVNTMDNWTVTLQDNSYELLKLAKELYDLLCKEDSSEKENKEKIKSLLEAADIAFAKSESLYHPLSQSVAIGNELIELIAAHDPTSIPEHLEISHKTENKTITTIVKAVDHAITEREVSSSVCDEIKYKEDSTQLTYKGDALALQKPSATQDNLTNAQQLIMDMLIHAVQKQGRQPIAPEKINVACNNSAALVFALQTLKALKVPAKCVSAAYEDSSGHFHAISDVAEQYALSSSQHDDTAESQRSKNMYTTIKNVLSKRQINQQLNSTHAEVVYPVDKPKQLRSEAKGSRPTQTGMLKAAGKYVFNTPVDNVKKAAEEITTLIGQQHKH